jgi:hypothetical protein
MYQEFRSSLEQLHLRRTSVRRKNQLFACACFLLTIWACANYQPPPPRNFSIVMRRYERTGTLLTSNRSVEQKLTCLGIENTHVECVLLHVDERSDPARRPHRTASTSTQPSRCATRSRCRFQVSTCCFSTYTGSLPRCAAGAIQGVPVLELIVSWLKTLLTPDAAYMASRRSQRPRRYRWPVLGDP